MGACLELHGILKLSRIRYMTFSLFLFLHDVYVVSTCVRDQHFLVMFRDVHGKVLVKLFALDIKFFKHKLEVRSVPRQEWVNSEGVLL